ncbi:general secretion pathway protein GspB [Niveibacterium sp.]|uniref:general secretion pathway protein GspB n=1 Tax=Niveibacterium sp. TaxID=2017444 RepID=UPI0035B3D080
MSYILDALRRAESERTQGRLPTPLDPPIAGVPPYAPEPAPARWIWMAGGAGVVLLAGLLGALLMRSVAPPARSTPPVAAAVTPSVPAPQSMPRVPAPPPHVAPPPPPTPSQASMQPAPHEAPARPPQREAPSVRPAPVAVAVAPTPASPAAPASTAPEEGVLPGLAELPEDIRRALPPMRFEGTVYSDTASSRMLMINGQLLHEGESFNADIRVERIKPRGAVLSYRGQRFEFSRP